MKTFRFFREQKGASMIEYALVLAGVAAIAGALFAGEGEFAKAIAAKFQSIVSSIGN